jgi:hypothetical protein
VWAEVCHEPSIAALMWRLKQPGHDSVGNESSGWASDKYTSSEIDFSTSDGKDKNAEFD